MKRYVAGFLISHSLDFIALVEKQRPDWQKGYWNGIGGKIEDGETPYAAMVREFDEECSISINHAEWRNFADLFGHDPEPWIVHFFINVQDFHWNWYTNYGLGDEEVKIHRVNPLPDKVIPNLRYLIPMGLWSPLQLPNKVFKFEIQEVHFNG